MSPRIIAAHERLVAVEFGAFYFGNWPMDATSDPPHLILRHAQPGVAFTETGVGFYSECYDDELALLRVRFLESEPARDGDGKSFRGEFFISSNQLAPTTAGAVPEIPFTPPFRGGVGVLATHAAPTEDDVPLVRDKWSVDIWPVLTSGA
ncbi:hypothetical protein ABZ805_00040 [Saccharopolyspora sp. NPDC047091]|uniref:hypothetical protein n=1 Tax=Saccharopolyspora sp. NPDC047091 TaxID=3155924 RepID=UPI0033E0C0EE